MRCFLGLWRKKEKQEDSVLAQRYRLGLLRKALFMGVLGNLEDLGHSVFVEKMGRAQ
ncbi:MULTISPECIES: hypothetical protein [unclassified Allomuricauda]|uniref:hypothetical protein n=1 Tax=unclassified Allomuricauda TaxID=2615049 RepID=UPI00273F430B|nr:MULTISPECIES: hypothetical protein [unclassified Allomuricauda]